MISSSMTLYGRALVSVSRHDAGSDHDHTSMDVDNQDLFGMASEDRDGAVPSSMDASLPAVETPPAVHAVSGAVGSALSILLVYPLERLRVEMAASKAEAAQREEASSSISASTGSGSTPGGRRLKKACNQLGEAMGGSTAVDADTYTRNIDEINKEDVKQEETKSQASHGASTISYDMVSTSNSGAVSLATTNDDQGEEEKIIIDNENKEASSTDQEHDAMSSPTSTISEVSSHGSEQEGYHDDGHVVAQRSSEDGPEQGVGVVGTALYHSMTSDQTEPVSNTAPPAVETSSTRSSKNAKRPMIKKQMTMLECLVSLHRLNILYQGAGAMTFTYGTSSFVYFYAHQALKKYFGLLNTNMKPSWKKSLLASSLAGIINVILTNPLWVVYLRRMQVMKHHNALWSSSPSPTVPLMAAPTPWSILKQIVQTEGIQQLWKGTTISILLVSNPVIQHFLYDFLKRRRLTRTNMQGGQWQSSNGHTRLSVSSARSALQARTNLSPGEAFLLGALAKAVSTIATYPLQLAQLLIRMQQKKTKSGDAGQGTDNSVKGMSNEPRHKAPNAGDKYSGLARCLLSLYRDGGVRSLYRGAEVKVLQSTLTSAFTFLTYEQLLGVVRQLYFAILTS
jgi:adenine nucleotide transporter 17